MAVLPIALLAFFAAGTGAVAALSVTAGRPGYAASLGYMEGFYAPNFPMPTTAITVEFWTKLLPVGSRLVTPHPLADLHESCCMFSICVEGAVLRDAHRPAVLLRFVWRKPEDSNLLSCPVMMRCDAPVISRCFCCF